MSSGGSCGRAVREREEREGRPSMVERRETEGNSWPVVIRGGVGEEVRGG